MNVLGHVVGRALEPHQCRRARHHPIHHVLDAEIPGTLDHRTQQSLVPGAQIAAENRVLHPLRQCADVVALGGEQLRAIARALDEGIEKLAIARRQHIAILRRAEQVENLRVVGQQLGVRAGLLRLAHAENLLLIRLPGELHLVDLAIIGYAPDKHRALHCLHHRGVEPVLLRVGQQPVLVNVALAGVVERAQRRAASVPA